MSEEEEDKWLDIGLGCCCKLKLKLSRGGSRKNDLENRKTAIGAFFCTRKIRMETGLIIENGLILPSKNGFENWHFKVKNRYFLSLSDKIGVIALSETPEFKFGVAKMCDE